MPLGVPIVWSLYKISQIHGLMVRMPSSAFLHRHPCTGERAICSSDFSAFTKWPYQPFCCVCFGPIFRIFSLSFFICTSATAIVERCSPRGVVHGFPSLPAMFSFFVSYDPHDKAPFTPPAFFFLLYVARLCTVKTLVGVPTAVALMLLVDCTSGHIFIKCDQKLYI